MPKTLLLLTLALISNLGAAQPNIIIIFCDDMGYADIGPFGATDYKTPHLDQMAAEGRTFTNFLVGRSVCTPSRASLMTGCYPPRVGIKGNFVPKSTDGLDPKHPIIPEVLKQAGYRTASYGKWHLGHKKPYLPTSRGFDEWFGIPYSNDMWSHHPQNAQYKFGDLPLMEGPEIINPAITPKDQTTLTKQFTQRTLNFITKNRDNPFFIYLAHPMPHVPLYTSEEFAGKSGHNLYGDVITEIDWSVGTILNHLKKQKLDKKTLVIFTSDNGPWLYYGTHGGSAGPLKAGKGTVFEGGFRVPCITWWPDTIPAGTECTELASTIDLLPTAAEMAQTKLPNNPLDGKNILPLLRGEENAKSPHKYFYYFSGTKILAIRKGPWKLTLPHSYRVITKPGEKGTPGTRKPQKSPLSLYNLAQDISESKNLAPQNIPLVTELQSAITTFQTQLKK